MLGVRSAATSSPEQGSEQHEQDENHAHNQGEQRHRLGTVCRKDIDYLTDRECQSGQRDHDVPGSTHPKPISGEEPDQSSKDKDHGRISVLWFCRNYHRQAIRVT